MLNTALNWVLRMVCCAIIFLGSAAIFAGYYLTDSGFVELFKTEPYYPRIQQLHDQLVPHHQQLLVGGISAVVLALLCGFLLLHLAQQSSTTSDHGSAKWAGFWTILCAHLAPLHRPRFILGKRGLLTVALPKQLQYQQVIIVAPNGQWKTTGFITPNLFEERGQRGIVTFDLKGELLQLCGGALSRYLQVLVWAPLDLPLSIHYNPLRHVSTEEDAADLAACWIENTGLSPVSFYNDTAQLLVQAAILHLVDTEPGAPFSRLADLLGTASFAEVKKLLTSSQSQRAREIGAAFLVNISTDPSMAGKIMAGMSTRFLVMRNRTIRELTADHPDAEKNLDFHRLTTAPQALFLNIPVPDVKRLQPITAALLRQLLTHLIRHPHQRGVAFYLDELCNAGRIPNYAEQISIVRGFNIALFQVIQNFAQLRHVYGQDGMESILENSNTKVFLPGLGKVESEYASDLAGERTIKTMSHSHSRSGSRQQASYTHRRLMKPDEIRRMKRGTCLIFNTNVKPIKARFKPSFKRRRYRKLAKLSVIDRTTAPPPSPKPAGSSAAAPGPSSSPNPSNPAPVMPPPPMPPASQIP